jgi:hypothetical protein
MQMFQGFKPEGMKKIQQRMGYTGPADQFQSYLQANPDKQMMMNSYVNKAMNMASGGYVRNFQAGGFNLPQGFNPESYLASNPDVKAAIDAGQFTSAADHFQKFGGGEDRQDVTGFSVPTNFTPQNYINPDINPDLAVDFEQRKQADPNLTAQQYAVEHYTRFGGGEDRPGVTTVPGLPDGPADARDEVTQPPPEDGTTDPQPIQPDPNRTFATFQDLQTAPRESLTPEQVHILNFYSNTPEQQEAINAMPQFSNAQLPVGQYQPGVRTAAPPPPQEGAGTGTGAGAGDTISGATGVGSVNGAVVLSNRPDVAQAIADGNTFGVDPATLEGLTDEQKNQRLAEAWFNTFGNKEGVNPNTGLSNTPSNFDNVSDQVIIDYLDQYPDLREAFGGPPYSQATLAQARSHYADFGRKEIAEGGRPRLVQFDLSPAQLEAFRYSNDEYQNLTPEELRRTYIAIGGASGATNFDRNAQILNDAEMQIYRDNNPDLANLSDFELRQHFIQFGRQEMLQGTRTKIDALVPPTSPYAGLTSIADISASRLETPVLADGTRLDAQTIAGPDGTIPTGTEVSTTASQLSATDPVAVAGTAPAPSGATATQEGTSLAQVTDTTKTATGVQDITDATTGRTMSLTKAKPDAAQQTTSAVTGQAAETGTGIAIDPSTQVQRAGITTAETVAPVAEASEAAKFVEQIVAQSANPTASATVAGQLSNLLTDFDASNPPSWAAGAMRAATAEMVRRGLGSSSIAGQAIVQAAMEAALPIAQADAQIQAQFEGQNLSNRQQMAVFYAQQRASFMGQEFDQGFQSRVTNAARVADIADKNFTAQQQVQLENSNIVNTMNLSNLSNRQAVQMAEIASLAQLDISNLNNRQQAAVMEAQAFLQKDLTDVSNDQQTTLFNAQQRIQSLFTDSAADNARKQFNASSDNQSNQFFANLATQTSQFNDAQKNAIAQFNAGQQGTVSRFNAEIENQRDQFNAQNRLVIDQANAVWRRQIATADTAAQNRTNELNASALLDISNTAYSDLWQQYSDMIEFAYTSAENELDRIASLAEANINADTRRDIADEQSSTAAGSAIGNLVGTLGAAFIGAKIK